MAVPHNRLIVFRPVTAGTNTPDAGISFAQMTQIPIPGLQDGSGVAAGRNDVVYVSDFARHVIYKVQRGFAGVVWAGTLDVSGSTDGQATAAKFNKPGALATDRSGNVFVVDLGNNLLRRIDQNANVFTLGPIPTPGGTDSPGCITVDDSGNIYFMDGTP